jgi:predicted regulator of Ras-like GTPase activity (Roadblock/LC7/MglB family)
MRTEHTHPAGQHGTGQWEGAPVNPPPGLNWLITAFAERVPPIMHAALLSSGGLPLACSDGLPAEQVDQLAAVASGLTSLVHAAARLFQCGPAAQTVVIMEEAC